MTSQRLRATVIIAVLAVAASLLVGAPASAQPAPADVTFATPTPVFGQLFQITGHVVPRGGESTSGFTVHAWSGGACDPGLFSSGEVAAAADGTFKLALYPACATTTHLTVQAQSDEGSFSREIDVPVAKAAHSLFVQGMRAPHTIIVGADRLLFWPQVSPVAGKGKFTVTRHDVGYHNVLVHGETTTGGAADVAYIDVTRNTVLTAIYSGDPGNLPDAKSYRIYVRAPISAVVWSRGGGSRDGWSIVHARNDPTIAVSAPSTNADRLAVVIQKRTARGWQTVQQRDVKLSRDFSKSAQFVWTPHHKIGDQFRVRSQWRGNAQYLLNVSAWTKFRFTR